VRLITPPKTRYDLSCDAVSEAEVLPRSAPGYRRTSCNLRERSMESQKRTILITGGTGFIGSNLAMRLLEADHHTRVVLFDRDPDMRRLTGFKSNVIGVKDR